MRTATFSDFCSNIKNYFNSVIDNCDSIIVNRNSDEAAVLLSLATLSWRHYILCLPVILWQIFAKPSKTLKKAKE